MKSDDMVFIADYGNDDPSNIFDMITISDDINSTKRLMRYSERDEGWTPGFRGTVAVALLDHGNGIKIQFASGKIIDLDYDEAANLEMMLNYHDSREQFPMTMRKYKETE